MTPVHLIEPYTLRRFVEAEHESIMNANQADHRATFQNELDRATDRILRAYEAWQRLEKDPDVAKDLPAALRFYRTKYDYREFDLCYERLCGLWVVAPRYAFQLESMRTARKAILGK